MGEKSLNNWFNFNVPSFVANLGYAAYDFAPPPSVARFWSAAEPIIALGVIALGYTVCLRGVGDGEAEFCFLCIVMLAASVRTWGHYFVFLIFPVTVAASRVVARPSVNRAIQLGVILILLNEMNKWSGPFFDRHVLLQVVCNDTPLYGLIALGIFFANELRGESSLGRKS